MENMKDFKIRDFLTRKIKEFPKIEGISLRYGYDVGTYFLVISGDTNEEVSSWKSKVRKVHYDEFPEYELSIIKETDANLFNIQEFDLVDGDSEFIKFYNKIIDNFPLENNWIDYGYNKSNNTYYIIINGEENYRIWEYKVTSINEYCKLFYNYKLEIEHVNNITNPPSIKKFKTKGKVEEVIYKNGRKYILVK